MSAGNLISLYSSAREVAPSGEVTVEKFVGMIRDEKFAELITIVRHSPNEEAKGKAKRQLPAVQLSGSVTNGMRAQAIQEGRFAHSGFLQLDVDGEGLGGKTPEDAVALLAADPHVLAAFISPSGKGAKGILRIEPCATDKAHKAAFVAVEKYILATYGLKLDASTKDPARLCFFSSDAGCTWNPDAQVFPVPELPADVSRPTANHAAPTGKPRGASKAFPEPPKEGIHSWLMEAAWHCRLTDRMTEDETIEKLDAYDDGTLRRSYQSNEVRNAVTKVFDSSLRRSIFDDPDQPPGELDLARYSSTDAGNADRVHAYAGPNFRYVVESGRWLIWDGQRWNPDNDGGMVRLFVLVMRETGKQAFDKLDPDAAKPIAKHAAQSLDAHRVTAGPSDAEVSPWRLRLRQ